MHFWKNVWWLVRKDIVRTGWGYAWNIMISAYFAIFTGNMFKDKVNPTDHHDFLLHNILLDLMFLVAVGVMGFTVTKEYHRYWRCKGISKKLRFLKGLPISMQELVTGRIIVFLLLTIISVSLFFAGMYLISPFLQAELTVTEYLELMLLWLGYGILSGSVYLILELCYSEKVYFMLCFVFILVYIGLPFIAFLLNVQLVAGSIELIHRYGIVPSLASIGIGALVVYGTGRFCTRRIAFRPLY